MKSEQRLEENASQRRNVVMDYALDLPNPYAPPQDIFKLFYR